LGVPLVKTSDVSPWKRREIGIPIAEITPKKSHPPQLFWTNHTPLPSRPPVRISASDKILPEGPKMKFGEECIHALALATLPNLFSARCLLLASPKLLSLEQWFSPSWLAPAARPAPPGPCRVSVSSPGTGTHGYASPPPLPSSALSPPAPVLSCNQKQTHLRFRPPSQRPLPTQSADPPPLNEYPPRCILDRSAYQPTQWTVL